MRTINIGEARKNFSKLIEGVGDGEEIMIARAGKPVAKLVPVQRVCVLRTPGAKKGRIHIHSDFDTLMPPDLQAAFEG